MQIIQDDISYLTGDASVGVDKWIHSQTASEVNIWLYI